MRKKKKPVIQRRKRQRKLPFLRISFRGRPLQRREAAILGIAAAAFFCLAVGLTVTGVRQYRHRQVEVMAQQELERKREEEIAEQARLEREAKELALKRKEYKERTRRKLLGQKRLEELREIQAQVRLAEEEREAFVQDLSCELTEGKNYVSVAGRVEAISRSDDEFLYLFAVKSYEEGLQEGQEPILAAKKRKEFRLTAKLHRGEAGSRLYDKFLVAVKLEGSYVPISGLRYITNPEAAADDTHEFPETQSKKGLLVDPRKLHSGELEDLGVEHAAYNIPIANILGETTNAAYPTTHYTYQGKTYAFNGQTIAEYDLVFGTLTQKGIVTTGILLNNRSAAYPYLGHPQAREGSAPYYMFNASEEEGVLHLAAIGAFLAQRYSDTGHGRVVNWVVANEINARQAWNYIDYMQVEDYTAEYAEAFRVFYTAIKSVSANARVYLCLDQTWNRNLQSKDTYDARDVLDAFNAKIKEEGDLNWGVAYHPYPVPLTWAKFWEMPANYRRLGLITETADTPMICPENVHVLTDYLNREEFLTQEGETRPVLLGEVGFTSSQGAGVQSEAIARAFEIVNANQDIDALILNRQTDAPEEIAQGLAFGLCNPDGSRKPAYDTFKALK